MDRLPLNSLRAFEAAARHLSMSRAAEELHLTHGAISHQIRALEELLGNRLFDRKGRGIVPTAAGQRLAQAVGTAFETIQQAMISARRQPATDRLTVTTLTSFAARWLAPRLHRFHARHPGIFVNLMTGRLLADLDRDGVDLAIRVGRGHYPGLHVEHLLDEDLFPVASPALADPPRRPSELIGRVLLRDDHVPLSMQTAPASERVSWDDWPLWCAAAGIRFEDLRFGVTIEDSSVLLDAVLAGQGIVLARSVLTASALATGQLVRLFDISVQAPFAYWLATLPERRHEPAIARFTAWIKEEAALFSAEWAAAEAARQGAAGGRG